MRVVVVFACLMGLFGALPARAAGPQDVFGREVPLGQGRPAVVLYANRDTRAVLGQQVMRFAYELRRERPIVAVVHVDLRGIPRPLWGVANMQIRSIYRDSLDRVRAMYRAQGEQPPADLEESLYMVADPNGAPHRELGLEQGFRQVLVQAVSASGQELARGPFPQASADIRRAIIESSPRSQPAPDP